MQVGAPCVYLGAAVLAAAVLAAAGLPATGTTSAAGMAALPWLPPVVALGASAAGALGVVAVPLLAWDASRRAALILGHSAAVDATVESFTACASVHEGGSEARSVTWVSTQAQKSALVEAEPVFLMQSEYSVAAVEYCCSIAAVQADDAAAETEPPESATQSSADVLTALWD